jgi:adenylate kinase
MTILFIGASGSGKDTQAELLAQRIGNAIVVSTGEILRNTIKEGRGSLAEEIRLYIDKGFFVPDALVYKVLGEYLKKHSKENIFLTGAVRTLAQIPLLDSQLRELGEKVDATFYLDLSRDEAVRRMLLRSRDDDTIDKINNRLDEFEKHIDPILGEYEKRGLLFRLDGERTIEEIHKEILNIIKKEFDITLS